MSDIENIIKQLKKYKEFKNIKPKEHCESPNFYIFDNNGDQIKVQKNTKIIFINGISDRKHRLD